jgi:DNA-binding response OmpR family regulator
MNVVIVDDDPDITKLYRTALEGEGLKIDTCNDPRKSLSNFKPDHYDIA